MQRIADYLGLFVDVLASTPEDNLRGARKAQVLVERFGHEGFAYVGNDATDLHVWEVAGEAVLVDTPASVAARVRPEIISRAFLVKRTPVATLMRAVRAHQWVKNLLLFVPIVTSHALGDWSAWLGTILAFVAFSLVASGLYLVNDLLDLESDRCHPTKSSRPLASGQMALRTGLLLAPSLVLAGLMVGLVSGLAVFGLLIIYGLLSTFYSAALKRQALVDVCTLATLYTLRLYAGEDS